MLHRVQQKYHSDFPSKLPKLEIDEDARSDWTIDEADSCFGSPLERFNQADDFSDASSQVSGHLLDALRQVQDDAWQESQRESEEDYDEEYADDDYAFETERRYIPSSMVTSKRIPSNSTELRLLDYLNTEQCRNDRRNLSRPVLDIEEEGSEAVVTTLRLSRFDSPPFRNVAECLDFVRQMLEGLAFFHEHEITHPNLSPNNIGMDPGLMPLEAPSWDRSESDVRYHLHDISTAFRAHEAEICQGKTGVPCTDCEAFAEAMSADLRALGKTFQSTFNNNPEMTFLRSLFASLIDKRGKLQPSAKQAVETFDDICYKLPPEVLFQPVSAPELR